MSSEPNISRREFITAAASAGITGVAGCNSGGAEEDERDEDSGDNHGSDEDKRTSTDQNGDFQPRIKLGEEFSYIPDPVRFADRNLVRTEFYDIEDTDDLKLAEESLTWAPWSIYRTQNAVNDASQNAVDYMDENAVPVTGRGLIGADVSDMATKIEFGLGEMGVADVRGMSPEEIKNALEDNFTEGGERNGRNLYTGEFEDERGDSVAYEMLIGHDGGHNIVYASDIPASERPSFFEEKEGPYRIMDQTFSGDQTSVVESDNHVSNRVIQALADYFSEKDHAFIGRVVTPEGVKENGMAKVGTAAIQRWDGDIFKENDFPLLETDEGEYKAGEALTAEFEKEDARPNYVTYI